MKRTLAFFTALVALVSLALAGEVETRVSRQALPEGQTFQLLLRYRGEAPARPELAPLESDFDVLDIGRGTRSSVINGVRDDSTDWTLTLAPHGTGVFTVPELVVGDARSSAFELRVTPAAAAGGEAGESGAAVIFEVEVDDPRPYVQGQVMLTARVLIDETIREGALTEPELEGALLERAGEDRTSSVVRDGKSYTQIERQYALFPQRSGEVRVPPLTFEAVQRSPARGGVRRSLFDDPFGGSPFDDFFGAGGSPFGAAAPFGGSLFDDFFDRGQRVRVRSKAIELDVREKPEAARGTWWLPARHVQLVEEWQPDPPVFRVGEQVTRRISIQALGLSGSQMPSIELPAVEGLKQYAQPARNDTLVAGDDAIAVRVQDFELVPTRPGELLLPAVEVEWWDLEADEARTARLPERRVQVQAGDASGALLPTSSSPTAAPASTEELAPLETAGVGSERWRLGALAGAAALLLGLAYLVLRRRAAARESDDPAPALSLHGAEARLARACKTQDPSAVTAALLEVGRARWPHDPPLNPAALARRLENEPLEQAVLLLERVRFAGGESEWDAAPLWRAYASAARERRKSHGRAPASPLPALYPVS